MSKVPAGARHACVARDSDLTCRVDFAAVESAEAEAEAEVEAEAELELDGGPSSLKSVWTGGTLHPQCSKHKENEGECAHTDNRMQIQ